MMNCIHYLSLEDKHSVCINMNENIIQKKWNRSLGFAFDYSFFNGISLGEKISKTAFSSN